jgi:hypothetical protein
MDRGGTHISERPLSGLFSGQACPNATANPSGHHCQSNQAGTQKEAPLPQAKESESAIPVGLTKRTFHRWRLSEINFLKENFDRLSNQALADALGMSKNKVRSYAYILGLKRTKWIQSKRGGQLRSWEADEIEYLQKNYHRFEAAFIGRKLNRTDQAIWRMAKKMNLKKSKTNGKI